MHHIQHPVRIRRITRIRGKGLQRGRDYDLSLNDIDTPFPRSDSRQVIVHLSGGVTRAATTNETDYMHWLGKRLVMKYYPHLADDPDEVPVRIIEKVNY